MSFMTSSKWIVLMFPVFVKKCGGGGGGGGGGGNNPSPSGSTWDWVVQKALADLPAGVLDALDRLPLIGLLF